MTNIPLIITGIGGIFTGIGSIVVWIWKRILSNIRRVDKIKQLEIDITYATGKEKENIEKELKYLKPIKWWHFWRRMTYKEDKQE